MSQTGDTAEILKDLEERLKMGDWSEEETRAIDQLIDTLNQRELTEGEEERLLFLTRQF